MVKKILRGLIIFIAIVSLFIIAFLIYLKLNSGDISKIDDSILMPSSQLLSKEDNAFYDFKGASDNMVFPENKLSAINDLANGNNWNEALANQIVNDNSAAIDAFNKGSWKKGYQEPALQSDIKTLNANTVLTGLSDIRNLAKISAIKSFILHKQGKDKEAFDNAINIIYAGQIIENSPRVNLIYFLVGMSVKGIGISNIQSMIPDSHLKSEDLNKYVLEIEKFKNNKTGLQEAFKMEYTMANNTKEQMIDKYIVDDNLNQAMSAISFLYQGTPVTKSSFFMKNKFYYKPNETQKLFYEMYNNFVNDSGKNCDELIFQTKKTDPSRIKLLFAENAIGKIMHDVISVSLNSVFSKRCQEEFSVIKTQIMLASQAYKNDKGSYPNSLTQLYPGYLDQAYKTFNGKDIIYNSATGEASVSQQ